MKIIRQIGKGTSSRVYLASHNQTHYAIKCVPFQESLHCILEPFLLMSLRHHSILSADQVGIRDRWAIYRMEYAEEDLHQWSKRELLINNSNLFRSWIFQILEALHGLHHYGILHGDLKASNILRCHDDSILLCDFSLSCLACIEPSYTAYTCTHRPPEVWFGQKWSYSADIWALGCTIFELLTGDYLFPFQGMPSESGGYDENRRACILTLKDWAEKTGQEIPKGLVGGKEYRTNWKKWEALPIEYKEFLRPMLSIRPEDRPTIYELLDHPWFSNSEIRPWEVHLVRDQVWVTTEKEDQIFKEMLEEYGDLPYFEKLLMAMYYRTRDLPIGSDYVIPACAHLVVKFLDPTHIYPASSEMIEMEMILCQHLQYRFFELQDLIDIK